MRRTYETVLGIAVARRDALANAAAALHDRPDVRVGIEQLLSEWQEEPADAGANRAEAKIQRLKQARERASLYAARCNAAIEQAVAALGQEHAVSPQLLEAMKLPEVSLSERNPTATKGGETRDDTQA